ncbi:MAG: AAA family ATPase [Oscillospiraceae bacterium]|jgi:KaiC/GvpD/RAD55 family RecA-like ATPase|nr:AAA family ATPase [Oscillospiraceae bacterium]
MADEHKLIVKSFADVPYEPPEWLIEPYFPLNKVTLLQGDPGAGKTAFMCKMAALVSNGGKLLDKQVTQGNVLLLSVEDDSSTLRGRIEASGGDVSKCFLVEEAYAITFLHEGLQDAIKETNAKLVVFDPIQNFLGSDLQMNQSNQTRPILSYLAAVAQETNCAIVLVAHMAKAREGKSQVLRSLGSADIPGAARSVIQIGRDPANQGRCVAAHVKSSNAATGKSISYTIGERGGVLIGSYVDISAGDMDTSQTRTTNSVPYEAEKLVYIVRELMKENDNIERLSYETLNSIAGTTLDGRMWNAEVKRLSRELYIRDKIIVSAEDRKTESSFVWHGETIKSCGKSVRGLAVRKAPIIDLDKGGLNQ